MSTGNQKNITVIGAGLVGSLLSIYLARRGYPVTVYERRGDMRKEKMSAGRSINLALSDRGLLALEKMGLADEIRDKLGEIGIVIEDTPTGARWKKRGV